MAEIQFYKMHANRNDFIIITEKQAQPLTKKDIIRLCDRRAGIGADQLITVNMTATQDQHYSCMIFNADGGSAQQCGNGLRCVAKLLGEQLKLTELCLCVGSHHYQFKMDAEEIQCTIGQAHFEPALIPLQSNQAQAPYSLTHHEQSIEFYAINVGNPHAVIYCDTFDAAKEQEIAQHLSQHPFFPEGININFMRIVNERQIACHTHERGVGPTPSCGSGACASAIVAMRYFKLNNKLSVIQPGGQLKVAWSGSTTAPILLSGKATHSYRGTVPLLT